MVVLLVGMLFALSTLTRIEEPLKELAQLPRCETNDVVLTSEFLADLRNFTSEYLVSGTGRSYFNNHYHYLDTSYSTVGCTFVVKYTFTFDELHEVMSVSVRAISATNFDVTQTNAFLRPVSILVKDTEAQEIALMQNITYDYYNKEIDISGQTVVYRFYRDTLAGTVLVLEIDAQSREIITLERPREVIPIV